MPIIHAAKDHPRSRGVYSEAFFHLGEEDGSSPLARGLRCGDGGKAKVSGIIPARAGFTLGSFRLVVRAPDHPRSRGVYEDGVCSASHSEGSSPLARGLLSPSPVCERRHRIIPARAGFTSPAVHYFWDEMDHPRSRGVYLYLTAFYAYVDGSSPLARGLLGGGRASLPWGRIIPARAGFT